MKRALSILLSLCLLLTVPALGATAAAADETPAGGYRLTGLIGGEGSQLEIVSTVLDLGVNYYLFLHEDGTGSMRFLSAELPLVWDEDTLTVLPAGENPRALTLPFTCDGGVLAIRTQAYALEFAALTEDEQRDYDINGAGTLTGMATVLAMRLLGSMDTDLVNSLFLSLALGAMGEETRPIPEAEPTKGTVSGTVDNLEITVLGAEQFHDDEAGDVIVFYFDMTNRDEILRGAWELNTDAGMGETFLEPVFQMEAVPELFYVNFQAIPGRTIRCAEAFAFDPAGGTVAFRVGAYHSGDGEVLYYADPQALSGAPEAVAFESDLTVPEAWKDLPEETENVRVEKTELAQDAEGNTILRCWFRSELVSEDGFASHYCTALQDGAELMRVWDDDEAERGTDPHVFLNSYRLRTGSSVYLVLFEEQLGGDAPVAVVAVEPG